jgi:hypothetical protein
LGFEVRSRNFSDLAANSHSTLHQYFDPTPGVGDRIDVAIIQTGTTTSGLSFTPNSRPFGLGDLFGALFNTSTVDSMMFFGDIATNSVGGSSNYVFSLPALNVGPTATFHVETLAVVMSTPALTVTVPFGQGFGTGGTIWAIIGSYDGVQLGTVGNLGFTATNTDVTVTLSNTNISASNPNGILVRTITIGIRIP